MVEKVQATVVNGVLCPDRSLPFPDRSRVQVTIELVNGESGSPDDWATLRKWILANPVHGGEGKLTRDQLHDRD